MAVERATHHRKPRSAERRMQDRSLAEAADSSYNRPAAVEAAHIPQTLGGEEAADNCRSPEAAESLVVAENPAAVENHAAVAAAPRSSWVGREEALG